MHFFTEFRALYEGHLTNKNQLPVTKINFGGLGQSSLRPREAKFELGPLYCSGADPGDQNFAVRNHGASPASCKDLWLRGHQDVSFIIIMALFKKRRQKNGTKLILSFDFLIYNFSIECAT